MTSKVNLTSQEGKEVVQLQLTQPSLSVTTRHIAGHATSRLHAAAYITSHHITCVFSASS